MRNALPPQTTEEVHISGIGWGELKKMKSLGIATKISAEVELGVSQFSVRARIWILWDSAESARAKSSIVKRIS
jgi:hypothetical protein